MLGTKLSFYTTSRALRGAARWGTLCAALALLPMLAGCPALNPDPCRSANCDDNNACTTDTCDSSTGAAVCSNTPVDCGAQVCDPADGSCVDCLADADCAAGFCLTGATAADNTCVECLADADCDDGNACTDDACTGNACVNTNNTAACDDGNACTSGDVCANGACAGTNNTDACDDGDACTENDVCAGGACAGTAIAGCCATDADCDTAAGEVCNNGTCEVPAPACTAAADCDDQDLCTDNACVNGACVFTPKACNTGEVCNPNTGNCVECLTNADCDDGVGCTVDACSGNTCSNIANDTLCDDNLFCTGTETCEPDNKDANADGCVSSGDPCEGAGKICNEAGSTCDDCTSAAQCDDGVPCTNDSCNVGTCQHANDDTKCPDPLNCDGIDYCDPSNKDADADGCVQPGNPCDPLLCDEGTYVAGDNSTCTKCTSNADCDDSVTCTNDTCDGISGACSHAPDSMLCPDALFCDGVDSCDPNNPAADADGCVPNPYACSSACNEATDSCFDCTSNADCDDGIDCTDDTCNGGTGQCSHSDNCMSGICNLQSGKCE